jgi:peptidoglycan/xylan/chitin deacetylase (PgdA/CDA1 family)
VKLALKIDVDTLRGTEDGVPRLLSLLEKHKAGATFLFSLGPDHTGRAVRRVFRKDFLKKVSRTSVLEHYGMRTLLYGTLLPGPDIGRRCGHVLRIVSQAGFEIGIHCWDHVRWQDKVARMDAEWTEREMQKAMDRFREVFGRQAHVWGAAGWQLNRHAAWFEERHFRFASDTRGRAPFRPLWDGVQIGCLQLPTTLPTLDELIGLHDDPVQHLLGLTARMENGGDHVFTAHAELEGGKLIGMFAKLLEGWKAQGYELIDLVTLYESLDPLTLPRCEVVEGTVPGRSGTLAVQEGFHG